MIGVPRILCTGLITVDLVFEVGEFPAKGTKNKAMSSRTITGGGALNAASAIASLGGDACLAGAIGDDTFGRFLSGKISERLIDDQFVCAKPGTITSRSANMISPDGDRTIINHCDAGLAPEALELPSGFPFDAALVDTRWPEVALQIVEAAKRSGKPAVVDAEAPVSDALPALKGASHVVFSQQGLRISAVTVPQLFTRQQNNLGDGALSRGARCQFSVTTACVFSKCLPIPRLP